MGIARHEEDAETRAERQKIEDLDVRDDAEDVTGGGVGNGGSVDPDDRSGR